MSFDTMTGGKALGAKFAGLGIATAVAFAVAGSPAIARADEVPGDSAVEQAPIAQTGEVESTEGGNGSAVADNQQPAVAVTEQVTPKADTVVSEPVATSAALQQEKSEAPAEVPAQNTKEVVETPKANETGQDAGTTDAKAEEETPADTEETADEDAAAEQKADVKDIAEQDTTSKQDGTAGSGANAKTDASTTSAASEKNAAPAAAVSAAKAKSTVQPVKTAEVKATTASSQATNVDLGNVYRMYNPNSGEHFYTRNFGEATHLFSVGWRWESTAYQAALSNTKGAQAVYRLYNPYAGAHFYTTNAGESNHLRSLGWRYEGTAWYAVGGTTLYRLYNPNSPIGEHLYTTSTDESNHLRSLGWRYEGTAWSVTPGFRYLSSGQWVVSRAYGSLERYWVGQDTQLAKNRFIETSEGSGWRAYATGSGAVIRNRGHVGSGVIFANNDGKLVSVPNHEGWWVTSALGGGTQRYYITRVTTASNGEGVMGARTGWFKVGGQEYYGFYNDGYVARNTVIGKNRNEIYSANNDGKLTRINDYRATGWKYADSVGSPTGWFLANSLNNYRAMIFRKHSGNDPWVMDRDFLCGYGNNTFMGRYKILGRFMRKDNGYQYTLYNTYYAYAPNEGYSTRWQMYHGSLYYTANGALAETGLGQKVSGGCIRLSDANAKYLYENVPDGSVMYTYR